MCNKILNRTLVFPPKYKISPVCQSFISGLLDRNKLTRLGCGEGGTRALKDHRLFSTGFSWDDLWARRIRPEFVPVLGNDIGDTRYFDKEFTKLPARESQNLVASPVRASPSAGEDAQSSEATYSGFSFSYC